MWPELLLETLLSLKVGIEALNLCRERLCLPIFSRFASQSLQSVTN